MTTTIDLQAIRTKANDQIKHARDCCDLCVRSAEVAGYQQDLALCDEIERLTAENDRLNELAGIQDGWATTLADLLNLWHPADEEHDDTEWCDVTEIVPAVKNLQDEKERAIRWAVRCENDERKALDQLDHLTDSVITEMSVPVVIHDLSAPDV